MQIVWFKRDLRVFDNEAFKKACDKGPILPLYIFEIDLDSKMYQFDTTAEIGKNIYLNGSGKYKSLIGYECTFAVKYYDEEYNFLVQKCKPPSQ